MHHSFRLLMSLGLAMVYSYALATTVTGSLPISATVISDCAIGTVSPVAFGNYDPTSASVNNNQGSISVTCTDGASYNIGLDPGTFGGATVTTRKMTGTPPGTPLSYALYRDSGRALNWGQTVGTDTLAGTGTGAPIASTVYGQIPALQAVTVGSYADTVTITVTF